MTAPVVDVVVVVVIFVEVVVVVSPSLGSVETFLLLPIKTKCYKKYIERSASCITSGDINHIKHLVIGSH